jgi:type II secretory pathway component GspD/PulD (secretin)
MDLHPEVSDLSTQSTVQGGVIINTSEADTRVMVENGQTAVIGGLIRQNEGTVVTGVPILMDIPILGGLFRNKSMVKQQRELVIFVTPKLVESFADAETPSDK